MQYKYVALKPETADRLDKLADAKGMKKLDLIEAMVAAMESEVGDVELPDVGDDSMELILAVRGAWKSSWRTATNIDKKTEVLLKWMHELRGGNKTTVVWECVVAAYALQQAGTLQDNIAAGEVLLKVRRPKTPR
jgi:hypothetical protein